MTRHEHLLTNIMEECAEVAQRVSKAQRFGMEQIQQDADDAPQENPDRLTNRERVMSEYYHLRAVMGMAGFDAWDMSDHARTAEQQKVAKVEKYLERSHRCGTLAALPSSPPRAPRENKEQS